MARCLAVPCLRDEKWGTSNTNIEKRRWLREARRMTLRGQSLRPNLPLRMRNDLSKPIFVFLVCVLHVSFFDGRHIRMCFFVVFLFAPMTRRNRWQCGATVWPAGSTPWTLLEVSLSSGEFSHIHSGHCSLQPGVDLNVFLFCYFVFFSLSFILVFICAYKVLKVTTTPPSR